MAVASSMSRATRAIVIREVYRSGLRGHSHSADNKVRIRTRWWLRCAGRARHIPAHAAARWRVAVRSAELSPRFKLTVFRTSRTNREVCISHVPETPPAPRSATASFAGGAVGFAETTSNEPFPSSRASSLRCARNGSPIYGSSWRRIARTLPTGSPSSRPPSVSGSPRSSRPVPGSTRDPEEIPTGVSFLRPGFLSW